MNEEQTKVIRENAEKVYKDSQVEINGRVYKMTRINHDKRKKIFFLMSKGALESEEGFEKVENLICDLVTYQDSLISKAPNHFADYPEDYIQFIFAMTMGFSYPFLDGGIFG